MKRKTSFSIWIFILKDFRICVRQITKRKDNVEMFLHNGKRASIRGTVHLQMPSEGYDSMGVLNNSFFKERNIYQKQLRFTFQNYFWI